MNSLYTDNQKQNSLSEPYHLNHIEGEDEKETENEELGFVN